MTTVPLPVGNKPGWELENVDSDDDGEQLRSVRESSVIYLSLQQSRKKWLQMFPRFSSRARGSKPALVPLPHTSHMRAKCDIRIGPHTFPDTTIFQIIYLPAQTGESNSTTHVFSTGATTSMWQSTANAYGSSNNIPAPQSSIMQLSTTADTTHLAPLPTSPTEVTPELIEKVNFAAASNPILSNLLQTAAAGQATTPQLQTLGLFIKSLANPTLLQAQLAALPGVSQPTIQSVAASTVPPPKDWDIVFQFNEAPLDRFIFPRGAVFCEHIYDERGSDMFGDIALEFCIPFEPKDESERCVASMKILSAPLVLWEVFLRWVGGEGLNEANRATINSLKKRQKERVYLAHQLADGPLLTQIQNAANPPPNLRPINPHQPGSLKRRAAPRKALTKRASIATVETGEAEGSADQQPSAKRRKSTSAAQKQSNASKPPPPVTGTRIACHVCHATDVPLIMGGRYCRPCADSGKASVMGVLSSTNVTPAAAQSSSSSDVTAFQQIIPAQLKPPPFQYPVADSSASNPTAG